jgi:ribosomal protein S6--L-glutamate ligase
MQRWISFDLFRTTYLPDTLQLKPLQMYQHESQLRAAQWVLFPEYWQLNALIYGYQAKVFPSHASYLIGHNKIEMTRAFLAVAPRHTPETHIHANTPEQAEALWELMVRPFVAKLSKSSQGEGVWLIESREDWKQYLQRTDVLYVQEFLPIDRDLRIVVIGDRILASYWRLQGSDGFHNNLARGGEVHHGPAPQAAIDLVLKVAKALDINHAGFDIAMVGEHPYLLELNRLYGNRGIEGGDKAIQQAIQEYLEAQGNPHPGCSNA